MNTKCSICGNEKFLTTHSYDKPDKYEDWMGISKVNRCWVRCLKCGFYLQIRNYDLSELESIYKDGYRDSEFRGESIEEAFNRIMQIENNENEDRYIWFAMNVRYSDAAKVLDIGSGIGVWPQILKTAEYDVTCVEENHHSIEFIKNKLELPCVDLPRAGEDFDTVSMIHVLEHIENPDTFLQEARRHLRQGGFLFVEVPDAVEFEYLPDEHDEFNSCHVSFFNVDSLYRLLERNSFKVTNIRRTRSETRNVSRIMCLATN